MNGDPREHEELPRLKAQLLSVTRILPIAMAAALAVSASHEGTATGPAPVRADTRPGPPANGIMDFVVNHFVASVVPGNDACPNGPALKNREIFLSSLSANERKRLELKENEAVFNRRWLASMTGPDGSNICTHYTQFPDRPMLPMVQSPYAWGLNLDDDEGSGSSNPDGCAHDNFTTPDGRKGIDNQSYRAWGVRSNGGAWTEPMARWLGVTINSWLLASSLRSCSSAASIAW